MFCLGDRAAEAQDRSLGGRPQQGSLLEKPQGWRPRPFPGGPGHSLAPGHTPELACGSPEARAEQLSSVTPGTEHCRLALEAQRRTVTC